MNEYVDTIVTTVLGTIAAIYAAVQWKDARRTHYAERRPYVLPEYEIRDRPGGPGVYIVLTNHGLTPAANVTLRFDGGSWHNTRGVKHPFLEEHGGISVVGPSQSKAYFVGRYETTSHLLELRDKDLHATIQYSGFHDQRKISESHRMTLRNTQGTSIPKPSRPNPKKPSTSASVTAGASLGNLGPARPSIGPAQHT